MSHDTRHTTTDTMNKRRGFTLVEAMVVIAIIGVLVAILIPAVQGVRESARRTTCSGNLKQIAHGILAYEHSRGYFPPQGWAPEVIPQLGDNKLVNKASAGSYSFLFLILPFVEQQNLYDASIPLALTGTSTTSGTNGQWSHGIMPMSKYLYSYRIPSFECPSDPKPIASMPYVDSAGVQRFLAPTNYAANMGDQLPTTYAVLGCHRGFFRQSWVPGTPPSGAAPYSYDNVVLRRAAHVIDGLSSTMAIGEIATATGGNTVVGGIQMAVAGWRTTQAPNTCLSQAVGGSLTNSHPDDRATTKFIVAGTGMRWFSSGNAFTNFTAAVPPNGPTCNENGTMGAPTAAGLNISSAWPAASSYHPGGVQVAMADGSTRFISDMIDYNPNSTSTSTLTAPSARGVWGRISTIASQDMVDDSLLNQ